MPVIINSIKRNKSLFFTYLVILFALLPSPLWSSEPILPIPRTVEYNLDKAQLGKRLFSEKLLSNDHKISCHSCHDFNYGGADPKAVSIGVFERKGLLNSPTVLNSQFNFRQFWNGRAANLKEQAPRLSYLYYVNYLFII
ncbi:MAG: cytochrome-c peroxidase [Pseudomonadota bacterium]